MTAHVFSSTPSDLFSPVQLGALVLKNRIVMSPLTRSRAGSLGVPGQLNADYYAQRASAGLIITEATNISAQARGYAYTPGIYNEAQVAGWRQVTDAVHAQGGLIVCQLWHVGRISHPSLQPGGELPVAPSAIQPKAQAFTENGLQPIPTPHALSIDEIKSVLADYHHATQSARAAGFDGVEIHAANGYLIEQFLKDKTNQRTDMYGGSIENRCRFLLEVVDTVIRAWDAAHVGVRLSPLSTFNDISDSNSQALFCYAVEQLNRFELAYLEVVEGETGGARQLENGFDLQMLRRLFKGMYIANNGYDQRMAVEALQHHRADLVSFGRPFIANPDLVKRFQIDAPLQSLDPSTLYGGDGRGYTDYPAIR
ncbi:MAG: alkene reductase [Ottowia sp.]|nr:alkene reductase [Ottowia sp.]